MEKVPIFVYVVCNERKPTLPYYLSLLNESTARKERPELRFFQEDWARARGGLDAVEYDLGETCKWFGRIGQIQLPPRRAGKIVVQEEIVKSLVDSWVASGFAREIGWRQKEVDGDRRRSR